MDCNCPQATSLVEIVALACGIDLTQIQRMGFRRKGANFDVAGTPTPNDILELPSWQAFRTAADDTKIVVTPLIGADPIIDAGDPITTGGGDNSTLNGIEENTGKNPSVFSVTFNSLSAEIERQLQALECELDLEVFFILQGNNLAASEVVAGTPGAYVGFPVQSMFVSDRNNAGFATKDTHTMTFSLPAGWSNNLAKLKPNFNPLTQL